MQRVISAMAALVKTVAAKVGIDHTDRFIEHETVEPFDHPDGGVLWVNCARRDVQGKQTNQEFREELTLSREGNSRVKVGVGFFKYRWVTSVWDKDYDDD